MAGRKSKVARETTAIEPAAPAFGSSPIETLDGEPAERRPGELAPRELGRPERGPPELGPPSVRLLLHGLQSPVNIGMVLRVAETYRARVGIVDLHGILANPETRKVVSDFSTGALDRRPPVLIEPGAGLAGVRFAGRLIATSLTPDAEPLPRFRFKTGDVVAIGNEYDGLPDDLVEAAEARLIIPMPHGLAPKPASFSPIDQARTAQVVNEGAPNLNAALASGLIIYAAWLQTDDAQVFTSAFTTA